MVKYCLVEDQKVQYRVLGNGKPVVLIHGFAEDGSVWDALIPVLSSSYKIIIPDLPGSGASDEYRLENIPPSIEFLADCINMITKAEVVKTAENNEPIIIGHSMGGYIGLAYAAKYPSRCKGLVLVHSTAYADSPERIELRKKSMNFVEKHGVAAFLKNTVPSFFSAFFSEKYPEKVELHISRYSRMSGETLSWYYEAMIRRPEHIDVLTSASIPFGFIAGMEDKLIPPDQITKQAALPNVSFYEVLTHSGHMGMIEQPEELSFFIRKFLQQIDNTD
jgi:pimeloyl-ACP methyl ester carboxylesterase